ACAVIGHRGHEEEVEAGDDLHAARLALDLWGAVAVDDEGGDSAPVGSLLGGRSGSLVTHRPCEIRRAALARPTVLECARRNAAAGEQGLFPIVDLKAGRLAGDRAIRAVFAPVHRG